MLVRGRRQRIKLSLVDKLKKVECSRLTEVRTDWSGRLGALKGHRQPWSLKSWRKRSCFFLTVSYCSLTVFTLALTWHAYNILLLTFFFNLCSSASSSLHRTNSFKRNQTSVFFRLVNLQILVVWSRLSQLYSAVDNNRLSSTPFFHQDQHPDRHLGPYWRWGSGRIYELQGIGARAELRLVGGLGHVSVDDLIHCEGRQTEKNINKYSKL